MVGRLVEKQHVGRSEQYLCQLDAHAPSAGELAGGSVEVGMTEAQALQRLLQSALIIQSAHHLEAVAQSAEILHQLHICLALIVGALAHLHLQLMDALLHFLQMSKSLFRLLAHGAIVTEHHHLRQIADGGVARHAHRAARGLLQSGDNLQHGAFPRAILAHQGNAVARVDDVADVLEQGAHAEFDAYVVYRNQSLLLTLSIIIQR